MRKKIFLSLICLATVISFAPHASFASFRIVSLAPVATEIVFSLGRSADLVSVTAWCNRPPEASSLPRFPDMMNVSAESVMALSPDIVLLSTMNAHLASRLAPFGIATAEARQADLASLLSSIREIALAIGAEREGDELTSRIAREALLERSRSADRSKRVLVVVSRDDLGAGFRSIYAAGGGSFYRELIEGAGATLAVGSRAAYLPMSRESIISCAPDMVIELIPQGVPIETARESTAAWRELLGDVETAVIWGDLALRPGPSYPAIQRAFTIAVAGDERVITEEMASR